VAVSGSPALAVEPSGGSMVVAAQTDGQPATEPAGRPAVDPYREALAQAFKDFKGLVEGKNADYIPALAKVDPGQYGIALVTCKSGRG
jgi:glutaminase